MALIVLVAVLVRRRRKRPPANSPWSIPPGNGKFVDGHQTHNPAYNASLIFRKPEVGLDYEVRAWTGALVGDDGIEGSTPWVLRPFLSHPHSLFSLPPPFLPLPTVPRTRRTMPTRASCSRC